MLAHATYTDGAPARRQAVGAQKPESLPSLSLHPGGGDR